MTLQTRLKLTSLLFAAAVGAFSSAAPALRADEHLFGFVRGAETLPAGKTELYQFTTLRAGKDTGNYRAWDFESEAEYGFSDQLQGSVSLLQNYFHTKDVPDLDDGNHYHLAGIEASAKYRFKSPFKDGYGLAIRPEIGFRRYDDVGGLLEHELLLGAMLIYQHNYLDDTLVFSANAGFDFTWGKLPAEDYDHELLLDTGFGLSYRFAPNWFAGVESTYHAEFPHFDLSNHEHDVVFTGPSLHFAARRWWATLTWVYQVWGNGVDEPIVHKTYAEETRNEYRLKVGFNF
jgi:hypothetical protein